MAHIFLAGQQEHAGQYTATDLIVVRVEKDTGSLLVDMSVSITVDVDDGGEGVCGTRTSVGGAIASAINGLAGGVFSLAALACEYGLDWHILSFLARRRLSRMVWTKGC